MTGFRAKVKKELLELLPAVVYFLFTFNLIAITDGLMAWPHKVETASVVKASIGALIAAKVLLLANALPFIERSPGKPLVYSVVWKTTIYMVVAILVQYLDRLIEYSRKYGGVAVGNHRLFSEMDWPRFWAIQLWLVVLFLVFVSVDELSRALGDRKLRHMFLGY